MKETRWITLEDAARLLGVPYERLWDYIMGRVPGKTLTVYRLAGGDELRLRQEDLLALLEPVADLDELAKLERQPPRRKRPDHVF